MALKAFISRLVFGISFLAVLAACSNQASPPPSQPQPPAPDMSYIEHTISYSGETLAEVSAWYTGKGSNWTAIRDANPSIRPDRLRLGQVILIPRSIVINEKPFLRKSSKKNKSTDPIAEPVAKPTPTESTPPVNDTSAVAQPEAPTPAPTEAANVAPVATPVVPAPTPEATVAPTPEPTLAPEIVTPKPASKDLEREKLLDELLK